MTDSLIKTHANSARSKLANLLGIPARDIIAAHVTYHAQFADVRLLTRNDKLAITCRLLADGGWAGHETWHDNFAQVATQDVVRRYAA